MTLDPDKQALKNATIKTIKAIGGGERAAAHTRVEQPRLSAYGNKFEPKQFAPIDVVADLESVIEGVPGAPFITRELARMTGHVLVPLPKGRAEGKTWGEHIAALAKESGDIIAKIAPASADGAICRGDVAQHDLVREAQELVQAAVELASALEAVMADTT